MKVLIAGGSGFVGTALGSLLMQENHEVYILTRRGPEDARQIQLGWQNRTRMGTPHERNGCGCQLDGIWPGTLALDKASEGKI